MDNKLIKWVMQETAALCRIPSPTGRTSAAAAHLAARFAELGFEPSHTRKGAVVVELGGEGHPAALVAHLDTLGAMVRSIKPTGRLRLSPLGGFAFNAIEGENCIVHTRGGREITGTIQCTEAGKHVFPESHKTERGDKTIELVLDEKVRNADDVRGLGVRHGDHVSFDPRTVITDSGFIKSRHLDDKASVGILLGLAKMIAEKKVVLARRTTLVFTTYEEVGHGGAHGIPREVEEIIAVDMGAMGDDLATNEYCVSICAKDSGGPYDESLTTRLVKLAEANKLNHAVDIYPHYSSDVGVSMKAGYDARHALVGPGVYASHGYERTHADGIANTLGLLAAYAREQPGA